MLLKWGIAATGFISSDFVTALKVLPSTEHQVVAIASRSQSRSDAFAKKFNIPKAYEGYVNLGNDKNVNIVYVGVLNPQHYEVVKVMLENGKHVLCEKPFTMNEKQTKRLLSLSKEKNLFLMEGIWSRCFPLYKELRRIIDSGEIGEVKHVVAEFGVPISETERIKLKALGGGTILDLGVYVLQFQQYIFRELAPSKFIGSGHLNEDGVDVSASGILTYSGNKTAVVSTTALVTLSNEGRVFGTKGYIKIPMHWSPTILEVNGEVKEFPLIHSDDVFNFPGSVNLAYEAREVRKCIEEGKIESSKITHEETLRLAQLMDSWRAQIGVVFPEDSITY